MSVRIGLNVINFQQRECKVTPGSGTFIIDTRNCRLYARVLFNYCCVRCVHKMSIGVYVIN